MATTNHDTPKGILLYQPRGAAGEYAKWALNLYNGCTHGCTYCYNRRGTLSHAFGDKPKLAAPIVKAAEADTLSSAEFAYPAVATIINKDIEKIGADRLRADGGIFMSFKCDPLEEATRDLTLPLLTKLLMLHNIPVTILTKSTDWSTKLKFAIFLAVVNLAKAKGRNIGQLTIGVTLTGMDDMEPNAPSTKRRIFMLKAISNNFKHIRTFVSLEPIVDPWKAQEVIVDTYGHTDEIRVGCQSPLKRDRYDPEDFHVFLTTLAHMSDTSDTSDTSKTKTRITLKHSVRAQVEFFPPDIRDKCLALIQKIEDSQS